MALLVVVVLLGFIGIATATGLYVTAEGAGGGKPIPTNGDATPADIKGSSSFGSVAAAFDIPLADLAVAFGLPQGTSASSYPLKNLEPLGLGGNSGLEVGVSSVRWFVALYKGLEYAPSETMGLTAAAVAILKEKAPLDDADRALLDLRTVDGS